jgi:hypothetical protein
MRVLQRGFAGLLSDVLHVVALQSVCCGQLQVWPVTVYAPAVRASLKVVAIQQFCV